jgi:hypothetical protein
LAGDVIARRREVITMSLGIPWHGRIGPGLAVSLAVLLAIPAQFLFPAAVLAEGEVPSDVAYATNPQNGTGNQYSAPFQWWKVALVKGDVLQASLVVTSEAGDDVFLRLYLPGTTNQSQNSQVAAGWPGHPFTHTATQTGDYLFSVYSFDAYDTAYTFTWSRTPAAAGPTTVTLSLGGLQGGVIKPGHTLTAGGKVTSDNLGATAVRLTLQKRMGTAWHTVKGLPCPLTATATYRCKTVPGARGSYRIRATVAATPTNLAGASPWRTFRVTRAGS